MPTVEVVSSPVTQSEEHCSGALKVSGAATWIFVTGQTGRSPDTLEIPPDFETQARQTLTNVEALLDKAGGLQSVVHLRIYCKAAAYLPRLLELRRAVFHQRPYPAVTTVVCDLTSPELLVEVDAIAAA